MSSTIKELLMSAEYIVAHGNPNVILCERGIRTFETATRNTCDITPCQCERTDAPAGGSRPSHATGKRSLCRRWHARAWPSGRWDHRGSAPVSGEGRQRRAQSLTLDGFAAMMRDLAPYIEMWRQARAAQSAALATVV